MFPLSGTVGTTITGLSPVGGAERRSDPFGGQKVEQCLGLHAVQRGAQGLGGGRVERGAERLDGSDVELAAGLHDRDVIAALRLNREGLEIGHLGRSG